MDIAYMDTNKALDKVLHSRRVWKIRLHGIKASRRGGSKAKKVFGKLAFIGKVIEYKSGLRCASL